MRVRCWAAAGALVLGGGLRAGAQATTATVVGAVTDASGASVANAAVELTEQATGLKYTHPTNETGNYEFTFLPPGVYTVKVSETGFQATVTKDVQVTVNSTVRTDVELKAGNTSETVTVTDQAPALQTDRADVSAQIASKQIVELPVGNSRNFQALESLVPGVSPPIYDHSSFFDAVLQRERAGGDGEQSAAGGHRRQRAHGALAGVCASGGGDPDGGRGNQQLRAGVRALGRSGDQRGAAVGDQ